MQSISERYIGDDKVFLWNIVENLPDDRDIIVDYESYEDFKKFSEAYRLGDHTSTKYEYIWYCDVELSNLNMRLLVTLFQILGFESNHRITQIISMITNNS